jgi:hypothetical protein
MTSEQHKAMTVVLAAVAEAVKDRTKQTQRATGKQIRRIVR